jgi:uncharacterized membrane protein
MHKRLILAFTLVLLAIIPWHATFAQTKTVFWEEWNVEIDNIDTTTNSFQVREIYYVTFTGTFRFGSRVIPANNLELPLRDVQVFENGSPLRPSCSQATGTVCVQQVQEGMSITYYFNSPITNAKQWFEIRYTVSGALRVYEEGDQIWWMAIPSDHYGFPIGQSTVTVELPAEYDPHAIGPYTTYGAPTDIRIDGNTVKARATEQITGNEYLEIRVQYPHNPNARKASWQDEFDDRRDFEENVKPILDVGMIALGLLLSIGGPLSMLRLWYSRGRDPEIGPVPEYLSEPPSDLPPAVVGALVDERADLRDVLSTLIDLGRRGYLVIEEEHTKGFFGLGGGSEFTFKRTDKPVTDLQRFEKRILQKVFAGKLERTMESMKNKFYKYIPKLQADLYDELVKHELFTSKPGPTRSLYGGIGGAILVGAFVLGMALISLVEEYSGTVLCIPISLGITGLAVSVVGQYMPSKTRKGAEEAAKWNAFEKYLKDLNKRDLETVAPHFEDYLPYAIAFGIDRTWIRQMSHVSTVGVPTWYYPTYRGGYYGRGYRAGTPLSRNFGGGLPSASDVLPGDLARASGGFDGLAGDFSNSLNSISDGLTNMLNSASRTLNSRPSSSSSGGGFSGGGFSGGGSSGGGSSGFG